MNNALSNVLTKKRIHSSQPANYQEALDQDSRPVPSILRPSGNQDVGPLKIPTSWYLDRSIHELEVERIWKRSWQMAAREEDLAEVGDTWVYDIANVSLLLVRSTKDTIKAFYNACLHRGVALRSCPGRVQSLQCPFHGFTWALDGSLKMIPLPENFPHINKETFRLQEVKVGRWDGFVFVNLDPAAESLETYLGKFPSLCEKYPFKNRVKTVHLAKVFPCNWKLLQEAFMEAWHVLTTHPQFAKNSGERCFQQEAWGNFSRGILGMGTTSDLVSSTPTPQEIVEITMGRWDDEASLPAIPTGIPTRQALATISRDMLRATWGGLVDELCDAEVIDIVYFTVFPNFNPFGGLSPIVYTFRPYGDDHTKSIMDFMLITPVAPGAPRPKPAAVRWLKEDEDFTGFPELGMLGPFVSQDIANLGQIMKGLRNNPRKEVVFAKDQELKIRHFYSLWQKATGLTAE